MRRQLCFTWNLDGQTAVQLALPRNTSTKPNLESTKLAEFRAKYIAIHDIGVLNTAICCKYDEKYEKKSDKSSGLQWNPTPKLVEESDEIGGG